MARSALHGYGLFAADFIPKDTRIIEYVGRVITKAEARRIEAARLARLARGEDACVYTFDITKTRDLDGDVPWNHARRINHACDGNCESQDSRGRIWIVARRDIAPGEELLYDYGFPYGEWRQHPCRCGAKTCVGYIVGQSQRWRVKRVLRRERRAKARTA